MKVLVIGFGSIGERHSRILNDLGYDVAVVSNRENRNFTRYPNLDQALNSWKPQYVVISNETSKHFDSLLELESLRFDGKILVEKPLFSSIQDDSLIEFKNKKIFVGYNLRFHPALQQANKWIKGSDCIISINAYCGQYLPTWRPSKDYKESYSASQNTGGGVLRDLSHEIDYTQWIVGPIEKLIANGGHRSDLEISSDDIFDILGTSSTCPNYNIHVNYLYHKPQRQIIVRTNKDTITVDLMMSKTESFVHGSMNFSIERDDTYIKMHTAVLSDDPTVCSFSEGLKTIAVIEAAESSVKSGRWEATK